MNKTKKSILSIVMSIVIMLTTCLPLNFSVYAADATITLKHNKVKFGDNIEFSINGYDTTNNGAKWIALYDVTDTNGEITEEIKYEYRTYIYPNGGTDYSFKTDATGDKGLFCEVGRNYKIRLYSDFSYAVVSDSGVINVVSEITEPTNPSVVATASTVKLGDNLEFTISNYDVSNTAAWIALYDVTDTNGEITEEIKQSYKGYLYLNESKNYSFNSATYCEVGRTYKAKLWANGDYLPVCESSPVKIISETLEAQVTVTPEQIDSDGTVTVKITGIDPKSTGLWLSFVDGTEANIFRYYDYKYMNELNGGTGIFTFDPTGSGKGDWGFKCEIGKSYKFFLFTDGGYNRVATSNVFTINAPPELKDVEGKFDYKTNQASIRGRITSGKGKEIDLTLKTPAGAEKKYTTTTRLGGQFYLQTQDSFTEDGIYEITATGQKVETPVTVNFKHDINDTIPELSISNSIIQKQADIGVTISGVSDKTKGYKLALYSENKLLWEKSIDQLYFTDKTFSFYGENELSANDFTNNYVDGKSYEFRITTNGESKAISQSFCVVGGAYCATKQALYERNQPVEIKVDNVPNPQPRDWVGMYKANEDNKIKLIWYGYLEELEVKDGYYIFDPETAFLEGFFMENASQYKGGESFKLRLFSGDNYENVLYTTQPFDVISDAEISADVTELSGIASIAGNITAGKDAIILFDITAPNGKVDQKVEISSDNGNFYCNFPFDTTVYGKYTVKVSSPNCADVVSIAFDYSNASSELLPTASLQKKIMLADEAITLTLNDIQDIQNDYIALYEADDENYSNPIWSNRLGNIKDISAVEPLLPNQTRVVFHPNTIRSQNKNRYVGGKQYKFVTFYGNSALVQCRTEKFSLSDITANCIVDVANKTVTMEGSLSSKTAQQIEATLISPTGKKQTYTTISDKNGEFSTAVQIPFIENGVYEVLISCTALNQSITVTFEYNMDIFVNVVADYQNKKLIIDGRIFGGAGETVSALVKNSTNHTSFVESTLSKLYGEFNFIVPINSDTTDTYDITITHGLNVYHMTFEYIPRVAVNNQTKEITISGYSELQKGSQITLKVINPSAKIDKLAQVAVDEAGYYEFSYTLTSQVAGTYKVYIGGVGKTSPEEFSFHVYNAANPPQNTHTPDTVITTDSGGLGVVIEVPKEVTNVTNPNLTVNELPHWAESTREFAKAADNYRLIKTFLINLYDSTTLITKVEGGKIKLTIPFEGDSTKQYFVLRYNDDNTVTELATTYKDGKITFETDHFSTYAIAVKTDIVSEKPITEVPRTADTMPISAVWILSLIGCALLVLGKINSKIKE
ncbi:MAG: hypothetical protein RR444_04045 [Oscillospiraceae bacterium]